MESTRDSRRAKYYVLTDRDERLNSENEKWGRQVAAIARIMEASVSETMIIAAKAWGAETPSAVEKRRQRSLDGRK